MSSKTEQVIEKMASDISEVETKTMVSDVMVEVQQVQEALATWQRKLYELKMRLAVIMSKL